ncbi:MAG TPA: hypothetical protein V6C93_17420 [Allocoleopsis sp.]
MGTDDPTAYLCVPEAIRFLGSLLPGGWLELMEDNRAKALFARQVLCEALSVSPPCPDEMVGSMAVVPLPQELCLDEETGRSLLAVPFDTQTSDFAKQRSREWPILQDVLFERFKIEVPIIPWSNPFHQILRISAQLYNTPDEYHTLAKALIMLLSGRLK